MSADKTAFPRLGKRELGPYAFENQYPPKIAHAVERDCTANSLPGVIPNLARLLEHDRDVEAAYLCTEHAGQVYKTPDEGIHFCGYHNIQMLCAAIATSDVLSSTSISETPSIPRLQDLIEEAWDRGFNSHGRILTGGIKATRKHIGTSEAEALFLSLDVPCTGRAFEGKDASLDLLNAVQEYFTSSSSAQTATKVHVTRGVPIFLQRPGHSLTVVGFTRSKSGTCRILTFDPAWQPPSKMTSVLPESACTGLSAKLLLKRYRKSQRYLKRYNAFETLEIEVPK